MKAPLSVVYFFIVSIVISVWSPTLWAKKKSANKNGHNAGDEIAAQDTQSLGEAPYGSEEDSAQQSEDEASAGSSAVEDQPKNLKEGSLRRSNRLEFDERLIKGQAAKSGAVYLFKRMPRHLPGLVPMRRSYRKRIVEPVLGGRALLPIKPPPAAAKGKKEPRENLEAPPKLELKELETAEQKIEEEESEAAKKGPGKQKKNIKKAPRKFPPKGNK